MKRLLALMLAAIMVFGLAAIGADAADDSISGTITFTHYRTDLIPEIDAIINAFMEEYPNVKVETEVVSDYVNNMGIRLSANEVPDVFFVNQTIVRRDDWAKYLLPVEDSEVSKKDVLRTSWEKDGHIYSISSGCDYCCFIYNKNLWKEAGIEGTPSTWEEFEADMEKLSKLDGVIPLTTQYKTGWAIAFWLQNYAGAYQDLSGGHIDILENNWVNKKDPFSDPVTLKVLDNLKDLVAKGYCDPDLMSSDWDMQAPDFAADAIGVYFAGNYVVSTMSSLGMDESQIGAFTMPNPFTEGETDRVLSVGSYGFSVSKDCKYPEAALALAEYLAVNFPAGTNGISAIEGAPCTITAINELLASNPNIYAYVGHSDEYQAINALAGVDTGAFIQEYLITDDTQALVDKYNATWAKAMEEYGK